jgi:uncharacterized membrane protein
MQPQILKKPIFKLLLLFAIALALHLPGISFHSMWFDETSTAYMVSQHGYGNLFKSLFTFEGTPPLFFVAEKAFVKILHLPLNEFSLRFLPEVYGAIACVLVFLIFSEISNRRTAILAFIAIAFSNFYVYLFQEARCYSMLSMMALLCLWVVMQWWKKANLQWTIALLVAIALTVQVHYYAMLWVAAICASVFFVKKKDRHLLWFLCLVAIASCISFGVLIPLFSNQILHEVGPVRNELTANWFWGIFYSPIKVLIGAYLFKIYTIRDITAIDMLGILPAAITIGVAGYLMTARVVKKALQDPEKLVLFSVCLAFLFHVILGPKVPTVHPRYMSYFLILLSGLILAGVGHSKRLQFVFFSVFIALNCVANIKYYDTSLAYIEPWREIAEAVDKSVDQSPMPGTGPVLGNFVTCHTLAFYLKNKAVELYCIPSYTTKASFARLNVFGNTCYSPLYHYDFNPVSRCASFLDIVKATSHGILLSKDKSGPMMISELKNDFKGSVDFSLLRIFKTNQGDLSILSWRYTGGNANAPGETAARSF